MLFVHMVAEEVLDDLHAEIVRNQRRTSRMSRSGPHVWIVSVDETASTAMVAGVTNGAGFRDSWYASAGFLFQGANPDGVYAPASRRSRIDFLPTPSKIRHRENRYAGPLRSGYQRMIGRACRRPDRSVKA